MKSLIDLGIITGHPNLSVLTNTDEDFSTSLSAKSRTTILITSLRYLNVKVQPLKVINLEIRDIKVIKDCLNSFTE
jgi:hypothetical protein